MLFFSSNIFIPRNFSQYLRLAYKSYDSFQLFPFLRIFSFANSLNFTKKKKRKRNPLMDKTPCPQKLTIHLQDFMFSACLCYVLEEFYSSSFYWETVYEITQSSRPRPSKLLLRLFHHYSCPFFCRLYPSQKILQDAIHQDLLTKAQSQNVRKFKFSHWELLCVLSIKNLAWQEDDSKHTMEF